MSDTDVPLPAWTLDEVSAEAMPVWAEALRDDNPIHLDRDAAHALGFGDRLVNQGPANLAYVLDMLGAARPGKMLARVDARFLGNVFSGDTVTATGVADADDPHCCRAQVTRKGETDPVLTAEVIFTESGE